MSDIDSETTSLSPSDRNRTVVSSPGDSPPVFISSDPSFVATSAFMYFPPDPEELRPAAMEKIFQATLKEMYGDTRTHHTSEIPLNTRWKLYEAAHMLRNRLGSEGDPLRRRLIQGTPEQRKSAIARDVNNGFSQVVERLSLDQQKRYLDRSEATRFLRTFSGLSLALRDITTELERNTTSSAEQHAILLDERIYYNQMLHHHFQRNFEPSFRNTLASWDGELDYPLLTWATEECPPVSGHLTPAQINYLISTNYFEELARIHDIFQTLVSPGAYRDSLSQFDEVGSVMVGSDSPLMRIHYADFGKLKSRKPIHVLLQSSAIANFHGD